MITSVALATASSGGVSPTLIAAIVTPVAVAVIVGFFIVRSWRSHTSAETAEGVILAITTLPTRPVLKQVAALRANFGVGKPPRSGFQRPIAVLDASDLRLTLNGSASTAYLAIPRTAITGLEGVEARDRLMRARAIRLSVSVADASLPLDLIPLDPSNPTTVATPVYVDGLLAQLQSELGIPATSGA